MVTIKIYRISGDQLFFNIPSKWCEECDLSVSIAKKVANEIGNNKVKIVVKPWINNLLEILPKGGWHPPVVLVNDKIISQGVVPNLDFLKEKVMQLGNI